MVAPGFIDVHTHADDIADTPRAENFVRMGVTSVVAGNCGGSALDIAEALAKIRRGGSGNQLRDAHRPQHRATCGDGYGESRPDCCRTRENEIARLAGDGRRCGWILDRSSIRPRNVCDRPPRSSSWRASPVTPAASTRRTCATRAPTLEEAIQETIRVGEMAMCRVQISHLKVDSPSRWGSSHAGAVADRCGARARHRCRRRINTPTRPPARRSVSDFPSWALEGGQDAIAQRLNDPETWTQDQKRDARSPRRARPLRSVVRRRRIVFIRIHR